MATEQFHDITEFSTANINYILSIILTILGGIGVLLAIYLFMRHRSHASEQPEETNHFTEAIETIIQKNTHWKNLPLNLCAQQLSLLIRESLDKELGSTMLYRTRHELNLDPQGVLKIEDEALAQRCQQHLLNLWGMKYQAISPEPELAIQAITETKTLLEDINHYCS